MIGPNMFKEVVGPTLPLMDTDTGRYLNGT